MMELAQALENIKRMTDKFAEEELRVIREHKEEAIPVLLEYVKGVADYRGEFPERFDDFEDHTYAMFLLAEFRVNDAFEPFIKILEFDAEKADWLLGDLLGNDFGAMIASVASVGDIDRIKQVIENATIDEYQRLAGLKALTVMYVEGVYAQADFFAYLGYLLDNFADYDIFISFVVSTCLDVYAEEHFERIRQMYQNDMIDESVVSLNDFDRELSAGKDAAAALKHLQRDKSNTKFIRDVVRHMSWWACFNEKKYQPFLEISKTIVRSEKKIGRNDPCPCGSGKKYKKCCINSPAKT